MTNRLLRSAMTIGLAAAVGLLPACAPHTTADAKVASGGCVTAGRVALRGVVRREIRLGPPGYGETPATDRRDTIAVLILPAPISLCADSALHAPGEPPVRDKRVALRTVPREILSLEGETVIVYGLLGEATFAWEYGPLVMRVDSVPAARVPARGRVS